MAKTEKMKEAPCLIHTLLSAEPTQPHSEPPKDITNTYQTVMKLFITPCGATLRKKCVSIDQLIKYTKTGTDKQLRFS